MVFKTVSSELVRGAKNPPLLLLVLDAVAAAASARSNAAWICAWSSCGTSPTGSAFKLVTCRAEDPCLVMKDAGTLHAEVLQLAAR